MPPLSGAPLSFKTLLSYFQEAPQTFRTNLNHMLDCVSPFVYVFIFGSEKKYIF